MDMRNVYEVEKSIEEAERVNATGTIHEDPYVIVERNESGKITITGKPISSPLQAVEESVLPGVDALTEFISAIRADERERCAAIAENWYKRLENLGVAFEKFQEIRKKAGRSIAAEIRSSR